VSRVIRQFEARDAAFLHEVFYSSVHGIASADYTPEQLNAWAPKDHDPDAWLRKLRSLNPFVVEEDGRLIGYADLQADGYIDHFYVAAGRTRQGIGTVLMSAIHKSAAERTISVLSSDVSLTAQPFFARCGFRMTEQCLRVVRGVAMASARMRKEVASGAALEPPRES
jgi:putative acetyltransferase